MSKDTLLKIAGGALLLLAAMCPVIFMALHHYVFAAFDKSQGLATGVSCIVTAMLLGAIGLALSGYEPPTK